MNPKEHTIEGLKGGGHRVGGHCSQYYIEGLKGGGSQSWRPCIVASTGGGFTVRIVRYFNSMLIINGVIQ